MTPRLTFATPRTFSLFGLCALAAIPLLAVGSPFSSVSDKQSPWPPRPENIVTWDSFEVEPQGGVITIPGNGGTVPIYTVPSDKFLVLTRFWKANNSTSLVDLLENLGGSITVKHGGNWLAIQTSGDPIGTVFQPGSTLVLRNRDNSTPPNQQSLTAHFEGYLVDY